MLKRYSHIYILIICILSYSLRAEGVDVPSARDLQRLLNDTCHEKLCLIKKADGQTGYFSRIMNTHQQIKKLESHNVIAHLHSEQASLIDSLCQGDQHPSWCSLFKRFQKYDQQRLENCTDAKCQLMRLYNQLNVYTLKLASILKPYNQELIKLNEKIYQLRYDLETIHGIKADVFNLHPNMLFL